MESTAFILLLAIAVIGITVFLFAGWLLLVALRVTTRLVQRAFGIVPLGAQSARPPALRAIVCPRKRCGAINPPDARFCRRCGLQVSDVKPRTVLSLNRAAMW